ncbi:MAG: ASPIC/UnbV domain-containing protein [Elusimicrobia bacterium]|nr:ASPIC/UnbV domain-containing protein [Elusimicrobiota bacterium]
MNVAGAFEERAWELGVRDSQGGHGLALIDYNNDGVGDMIVANVDSNPILYQGEYSGDGSWLGVEVIGRKSNRNAIGARVDLFTTRQHQVREIFPTNGFQSQSSQRQLFGIPAEEKIVRLTVQWPDGTRVSETNVRPNQYVRIEEPEQDTPR